MKSSDVSNLKFSSKANKLGTLFIIALTLALSACDTRKDRPGFEADSMYEGQNTLPQDFEVDEDSDPDIQYALSGTGSKTEVLSSDDQPVSVDYKLFGHRQVFRNIRKEVSQNLDTILARSIFKVNVQLSDKDQKTFNPFDPINAQNQKSPLAIKIEIELQKSSVADAVKLSFSGPMTLQIRPQDETHQMLPTATDLQQNETNLNNHSFAYKVDARCLNVYCSLIDIRLKKFSNLNVSTVGLSYGPQLGSVAVLFEFAVKRLRLPEDTQTAAADETPTADTPAATPTADTPPATPTAAPEAPAPALEQIQKLSSRSLTTSANVTSFAVTEGMSHAHIEVPNVFEMDVPLVDTSVVAAKVPEIKIENAPEVEAQLIGLNEKNGSMAIAAIDKKTNQEIALFIEEIKDVQSAPSQTLATEQQEATAKEQEARPDSASKREQAKKELSPRELPTREQQPAKNVARDASPAATPENKKDKKQDPVNPQQPPSPQEPIKQPLDKGAPGKVSSSLFLKPNDTKNLPEATRVSKAFAAYENDAEVLRMIRVFQGKAQNRRNCTIANYGPGILEQFVVYAPPITPYLEAVTTAIDVTPEIGYLMAIESTYARSDRYHAAAISASHALGPWQITTQTGQEVKRISGLPFNIHRVSRGNFNNADDRSYFMNSTYMAAIYLKYLFKRFPTDPALAILAYNWGPTITDQKIDRLLERYSKLKVRLSEIFEYQMQNRTNVILCERMHYAFSFLAARAIGQNLEKYFDVDTIVPYQGRNFEKRLYRPGGPLPPGVVVP